MEVASAHLRYLYAIYELSKTTPDVGCAALARALDVTKPSVTWMLDTLMEKHLVIKKRYGKIYLTDEGYLLARDFDRRVELLAARIPLMELALTPEEVHAAARAMAEAVPGVGKEGLRHDQNDTGH